MDHPEEELNRDVSRMSIENVDIPPRMVTPFNRAPTPHFIPPELSPQPPANPIPLIPLTNIPEWYPPSIYTNEPEQVSTEEANQVQAPPTLPAFRLMQLNLGGDDEQKPNQGQDQPDMITYFKYECENDPDASVPNSTKEVPEFMNYGIPPLIGGNSPVPDYDQHDMLPLDLSSTNDCSTVSRSSQTEWDDEGGETTPTPAHSNDPRISNGYNALDLPGCSNSTMKKLTILKISACLTKPNFHYTDLMKTREETKAFDDLLEKLCDIICDCKVFYEDGQPDAQSSRAIEKFEFDIENMPSDDIFEEVLEADYHRKAYQIRLLAKANTDFIIGSYMGMYQFLDFLHLYFIDKCIESMIAVGCRNVYDRLTTTVLLSCWGHPRPGVAPTQLAITNGSTKNLAAGQNKSKVVESQTKKGKRNAAKEERMKKKSTEVCNGSSSGRDSKRQARIKRKLEKRNKKLKHSQNYSSSSHDNSKGVQHPGVAQSLRNPYVLLHRIDDKIESETNTDDSKRSDATSEEREIDFKCEEVEKNNEPILNNECADNKSADLPLAPYECPHCGVQYSIKKYWKYHVSKCLGETAVKDKVIKKLFTASCLFCKKLYVKNKGCPCRE